jgi:HAD superfamily hydrolase (TIGR01484 family)
MTPRQIASDLDGTLIANAPGDEHDRALGLLTDLSARGHVEFTYITGRHLSLALAGIHAAALPPPARIFCDVGTSLYHRVGDDYVLDARYRAAMHDAFGFAAPDALGAIVAGVPGLEPQPAERQAEFKRSFVTRHDAVAATVAALCTRLGTEAARLTIVTSLDPVTGAGLVDILPRAAGKGRALAWLTRALALGQADVLFAGDSGNDRDAFLSGHPAVLVGNAPDAIRTELRQHAGRAGLADRLYFAKAPYAAGLVEGARHFGFMGKGKREEG